MKTKARKRTVDTGIITKGEEHLNLLQKAAETYDNLKHLTAVEIEGQVRIVTVPGYDVCACCAPHVKSTREVGLLKVLKVIKYKK